VTEHLRHSPITNRVTFERREFVCVSWPKKREDAQDLRNEHPEVLDTVSNADQHEHRDAEPLQILLIPHRAVTRDEHVEPCRDCSA